MYRPVGAKPNSPGSDALRRPAPDGSRAPRRSLPGIRRSHVRYLPHRSETDVFPVQGDHIQGSRRRGTPAGRGILPRCRPDRETGRNGDAGRGPEFRKLPRRRLRRSQALRGQHHGSGRTRPRRVLAHPLRGKDLAHDRIRVGRHLHPDRHGMGAASRATTEASWTMS